MTGANLGLGPVKNSSYVSDVRVCIYLALYVRMFVARANKVEGTMS